MDSALLVFVAWLAAITLTVGCLAAVTSFMRARRAKSPAPPDPLESRSMTKVARLDREGAYREVVRLRDGGRLDDSLIERMSSEERALLEVALIDALTEWPRDDQHKLRSTLIKHGYDDQCARRLMKDSLSSSVRAATLLALLRPQSRNTATPSGRSRKPSGSESSHYC